MFSFDICKLGQVCMYVSFSSRMSRAVKSVLIWSQDQASYFSVNVFVSSLKVKEGSALVRGGGGGESIAG